MKIIKLFSGLLLSLLLPQFASAVIVAPYTPDANTTFLFHFDEAAGGSVTTNLGTVGGNAYTVTIGTNTVNTTRSTNVTTLLGGAAFSSSFTNAISFPNTNTGLMIGFAGTNSGFATDTGSSGTRSTNAIAESVLGIGASAGAPWTIEAMIKTSNTNFNQEIVCMDSYAGSRGFQFKIDGPNLQFQTIGGTAYSQVVALPTTGDNAFVANSWYHVAVVYNGATMQFYWTAVNSTNTVAVTLGSAGSPSAASMGTTQGAITGPLLFGNKDRLPALECLNGEIDEVRISNVARGAGQMLFAPATVSITQQPVVQEGVDYGDKGSLTVGATSASALGYQWWQNTTPLSNATNTTYTFTNATAANAGSYFCVITNLNGSAATSSVAAVTIGAANFLAHRYGFTNDYTDSIGGATGTNFGDATLSGGALQLDGTSGTYLQLPGGLVTNQGAITIETWATFSTLTANSWLFGFGDTNGTAGTNYLFCTPKGSAARIAITSGSSAAEQGATSGNSLDNATGMQIVAVFAPDQRYEALYTNGVLAAINTNVTVQLASVVNHYSFIGQSLYSADPSLTGSVDEFRIYNGALSADTIRQSYLQGPDNGLSAGPVQILVSPTNTTVASGQTATFSGLAAGLPAISYQWFKNGALIPGATNRIYSYPTALADKGAAFVLMATNTVNSVVYTAASSAATLTVVTPETLVWLGGDSYWNTSSLNWSNAAQSLVAYAQFDGVLFDDRGASQTTVDFQFDADPVSLVVSNTAENYKFTSSAANGSLTVLGTLRKTGSGLLAIDVTNLSTGPVVIDEGTVQVGSYDAVGSLGSGPVTNNATLTFVRNDNFSVVNDLHGTGPVNYINYNGSVTPTSPNNDYTGGTAITGGILYLLNTNSLGAATGSTTVGTGAQLYVTNNVDLRQASLTISYSGPDSNGALRKGGAGTTTCFPTVTLASDATIGVDTNSTLNLTNAASITGTDTSLTFTGAGTNLVAGTVSLGSGGLTVSSGAVILNGANSYSGATTVNGGVLMLNNSGALGSSPQVNVASTTGGALGGTRITLGAGVAIPATAALSLPTAGTTVRSCLYAAGASSWNGPITINGDSTISPGDQLAFASAGGFLTIGGSISSVNFPGTLQLRGDGTGSGSAVDVTTNGYGGAISGTITLATNATLQVHDGVTWTINATGNTWDISEIAKGTLKVGVNNALPVATCVKFGAVGNAQLDLAGNNQQVGSLIVVGNAATITNSSTTGDSTLTFNCPTNSTFGGRIVDGPRRTALTVAGGILALAGTNTYTGDTLVSAGTLTLTNNGTLGTTNITVASGATLNVSAHAGSGWTLGAAQTLKGNGTVSGSLTNAGTLAPGIGIGALTVSGNLTLAGLTAIEISKAAATNDQLIVSGAVNYGGTLYITNLAGTLKAGDSFNLVTGNSSWSGGFSAITGTPAGTNNVWSFNPTNGVLSVVASVNTQPTNLIATVSGGSLILSWPADHTGWTLQAQTNALTGGLGTNWVDVTGSAQVNVVTNVINPTNGAVFYRMIYR
jgi:autotransporter-associated beta strand protein